MSQKRKTIHFRFFAVFNSYFVFNIYLFGRFLFYMDASLQTLTLLRCCRCCCGIAAPFTYFKKEKKNRKAYDTKTILSTS